MNVKSLYDQCVEFVSEHVSTFHTYSDIINNFWGEIPKSCLNDILTEHVKNCRAVDIDYISVYPTDANSYISRICYDCHSVIEEPSFVSLRYIYKNRKWSVLKQITSVNSVEIP